MPMSPFAAPSGGSPEQEAAAQAIQARTMPQGMGEGKNPVAMHLAAAFDALIMTGGPTPENVAALQQFFMSLQELGGGGGGGPGGPPAAAPPGLGQQLPQGQGPMPMAGGGDPMMAPPPMV